MSAQVATVESIMAMLQETALRQQETDRIVKETSEQMKETDRLVKETSEQMKETERIMKERDAEFDRKMKERDAEYDRVRKETNRKIGEFTGSMGKVIEHMVAGHSIIKKFQALDYIIESYSRNKTFGHSLPKEMWGEIDLFLENGDIAILIEVKTTLGTKDVRTHIARLEKFRRVADIKGDKRRFIGAVAGAIIDGDAEKFAHENGMYVIVQSGKAVDILPTPEGFVAKEW